MSRPDGRVAELPAHHADWEIRDRHIGVLFDAPGPLFHTRGGDGPARATHVKLHYRRRAGRDPGDWYAVAAYVTGEETPGGRTLDRSWTGSTELAAAPDWVRALLADHLSTDREAP